MWNVAADSAPSRLCVVVAMLFLASTAGYAQSSQSDSAAAPVPESERRPAALPHLYISFVSLQVLDVHSTLLGLESGGREANPVLRPLAGSTAALVAMKAGHAAAAIYLSERLWKSHHRTAAIFTMAALNSAYVAVVAHNYHFAPR